MISSLVNPTFITLFILSIVLLCFLVFLLNKKNKKQLDKIFIVSIGLLIFWLLCYIIQIFAVEKYNANPLYFDYFTYISVCLLPVSFFFMALIFTKTKIHLRPKYMLLFVVPIISLIVLWTNNYHHLFYEVYSTDFSECVYVQILSWFIIYNILIWIYIIIQSI